MHTISIDDANNIAMSRTYFNLSCVFLFPVLIILTFLITIALLFIKRRIVKYTLIAIGGMLIIWLLFLFTTPMWWPPILLGETEFKYSPVILPHSIMFIGILGLCCVFVRRKNYGGYIVIALILVAVIWLTILLTLPIWIPTTLFKHTELV